MLCKIIEVNSVPLSNLIDEALHVVLAVFFETFRVHDESGRELLGLNLTLVDSVLNLRTQFRDEADFFHDFLFCVRDCFLDFVDSNIFYCADYCSELNDFFLYVRNVLLKAL